jgi:glycosyltransferase involved in cell wall biosynthesis
LSPKDDGDPLVSVVLPTRDRPDQVAEAVRSVLAQSHRNLQLIVVDDGSTHSVEDLLGRRGIDDSRLTTLRLESSLGAAAARNAGLERAEGELVAFLDDDDTWTPNKLDLQVEFLSSRPYVGMVSCDHFELDNGDPRRYRTFRGPREYDAEHVQWMNFPGSFSFVMVNRKVVEPELTVDETFPSVEDWDLWLRLARVAPCGVVGVPLVRHKVHGGLSRPPSELRGTETFLRKHAASVPPACRHYLEAHVEMLKEDGWAHRRRVARSVFSPSLRASRVLVLEQLARQAGKLARDPGLVARVVAATVERDARR